jgi:monofunctional biosynthetic peptidoglycan transglycosylase
VYGVEAAAQYHYGGAAAGINREQAARLAAVLPAPLRYRPGAMNVSSKIILGRMLLMGW